jgi:hypothetical protein
MSTEKGPTPRSPARAIHTTLAIAAVALIAISAAPWWIQPAADPVYLVIVLLPGLTIAALLVAVRRIWSDAHESDAVTQAVAIAIVLATAWFFVWILGQFVG